MSTIITLDGVTFDPSLNLPKLPLDGYDGAGVLLIHDYRRTRCLAAGAPTENGAVRNLSRNTPPNITDGVIYGAANMVRDGAALHFAANSSGLSFVRATGLGGNWLDTTRDWVATAWVRQNTADDFQGVIGSANDTGVVSDPNNSFGLVINGTADPYGMVAWFWDTTGNATQYGMPTRMPVSSTYHQVSIGATHSGGQVTMWLGLDSTASAMGPAGASIRTPTFPLQVGTVGANRQGHTSIMRATLAYVGAGCRYSSVADAVAADWQLNHGQF